MRKYEAMVIVKPDLSEEAKKGLLNSINDSVTKNGGNIEQAAVWMEKRKLYFPMKKCQEGLYYLLNFDIAPAQIAKITQTYKINEDILRFLITLKG